MLDKIQTNNNKRHSKRIIFLFFPLKIKFKHNEKSQITIFPSLNIFVWTFSSKV